MKIKVVMRSISDGQFIPYVFTDFILAENVFNKLVEEAEQVGAMRPLLTNEFEVNQLPLGMKLSTPANNGT